MAVYKKESVHWPKSELRSRENDEISVVTGEVSDIQMLLILVSRSIIIYNVYEDRIGLEKFKCVPINSRTRIFQTRVLYYGCVS